MKKTLKVLLASLIVLSFLGVYEIKNATASFDPGNIISDAEFVNSGTLDATGVQMFLNSHGGTRLRTFSEGGKTAAQIIAAAARSNGINPIVILATIQKEESLVDSNTNFDYRVRWAMGYGICDSCSPDDPNIAKYSGFTNQVNSGAWQLRHNYSLYAVNGSDWNVGKTMIIDGTAVRFATRATSALYRYTPHLSGNESFANIYNRYKTFRYAAKSIKTKKTLVNSSEASYDAQVTAQVGKAAIAPGQKQKIYIYLKNTGNSTWLNSGSNPAHIGNSSPQDRGSAMTGGANVRWAMLSRSVAPGKVGVFALDITAPNQTGTYVEKYRPLIEGVSWFGPEISFTFNVSGKASKAK